MCKCSLVLLFQLFEIFFICFLAALASTKVLTPVQEAARLSDPAEFSYGLDGIEEEQSTTLTRLGSKAPDKSLSKKRIKSKSQPKTVKEVRQLL